MQHRRGHRHELTIDNQTVWLDSLNEAIALGALIDIYGFGGRWVRPVHGIMHDGSSYTPDFELSVATCKNLSCRALVEVKEYRRDFHKDRIRAIIAVAKYYKTSELYLYSTKHDAWYAINAKTAATSPCPAPQPGALKMEELYKPRSFNVRTFYGRTYRRSIFNWLIFYLCAVARRRTPRR